MPMWMRGMDAGLWRDNIFKVEEPHCTTSSLQQKIWPCTSVCFNTEALVGEEGDLRVSFIGEIHYRAKRKEIHIKTGGINL